MYIHNKQILTFGISGLMDVNNSRNFSSLSCISCSSFFDKDLILFEVIFTSDNDCFLLPISGSGGFPPVGWGALVGL